MSITTLQFVDCSSNNPMPNLREYAASGRRWIFRKVSEGTGYHWDGGDLVAAQAHTLGLRVGHYGWLRPDEDPEAQAAAFLKWVEKYLHPEDVIACDYEATYQAKDPDPETRGRQLDLWTNYVHKRLPANPLYVYTGNWYLAGKKPMIEAVKKWPVWISDYNQHVTVPNPYGLNYAAIQFTDRATVPGFTAPVDQSRWLVEPKAPGGNLIMDKEVAKAFADVNAKIDAVHQRLDTYFLGSDGHHHTLETTLAHVVAAAPYQSHKGNIFTRLFRIGK